MSSLFSMFRSVLFLLFLTALPAFAAPEKRVWRVDSIVATQSGANVVVQVKGAVQSGGWHHPHLKVAHGDTHTLVVEFLAQPPGATATVISGLLPITATVTVRADHAIVSVKALAEANEVTTQVLH
ncbi:MAG: hypothetical protein JO256_04605 [Alphaproteobacteria bacterium]|nr:hypothetical protein [Alphaproteobacteria bacterium]